MGMYALNESDFYRFLLRTALPKAKAKLPKDMKDGNLVWDAVWRAHCDVVQARGYVKGYSSYGKEPWVSQNKHEANIVPARLYELLTTWSEDEEPLSSRVLIDQLQKPFEWRGENVDLNAPELFGPIQKLVNMTLKYLVMLRTFHVVDETLNNLPGISLDQCDCPLDSAILDSLGGDFGELRWTRITREEYKAAQEKIAAIANGPRLAYDLKVWPGEALSMNAEEND